MNGSLSRSATLLAVLLASMTLAPVVALAHPGRTASDGCHYCHTNCSRWNVPANQRHCHGGSSAPSASTTETQPRTPAVGCPAPTGTWRGLKVAAECRCSRYDGDDYRYSQSVEPPIARALGGAWSPYDGTAFESLRESDIEHIVARSEAHDSGLCAAGNNLRALFARDPDNLTLASPRVNRHEKSDKDAAEWMPDLNRCWFAARVVAVRLEYNLTVDRREADALEAILKDCTDEEMERPVQPR